MSELLNQSAEMTLYQSTKLIQEIRFSPMIEGVVIVTGTRFSSCYKKNKKSRIEALEMKARMDAMEKMVHLLLYIHSCSLNRLSLPVNI